MSGAFLKTVKKHAALIPLYVLTGLATFGALGYGVRLALQNPDVKWNRRKNELSNEEYREKQYNFYSPNVDYSKLESPAPKY